MTLLACAAAIVTASCKRDPALMRPDAEASDEPVPLGPVVLPEAGPPLAAARCTVETSRVRLADATNGDVEVGDGIVTSSGYAIGLVRATPKGRVASLALVPTDLSKVTLIDLGPAVGEAPPPQALVAGDALYAAYHGRGAARSFEIFRIDRAHANATRTHAIVQPKDESFATDVSFAPSGPVVVWDEATLEGATPRGQIRVAALTPLASDGGASTSATTTLSAKTADADGPRIARRTGGFWVVWTAHRAEREARDARDSGKSATPRGASAYEAEGPAEEREYRWLEAVALDDAGHAAGAVHSLTPHTGHVEAFDLAPRSDGAAVDVLATDATEARDGEGGHVTRITLRDAASAPEAPVVLTDHGVGHASAELLAAAGDTSARPWLSFVDPSEHTRVLPLNAGRGADASTLASIEPALEGGRPMFAVARGGGLDARTALVSLFDDKTGAELRTAACTR